MMSTEERGLDCLEGWRAREVFMEEIICELRHEGAHSVKGVEEQTYRATPI